MRERRRRDSNPRHRGFMAARGGNAAPLAGRAGDTPPLRRHAPSLGGVTSIFTGTHLKHPHFFGAGSLCSPHSGAPLGAAPARWGGPGAGGPHLVPPPQADALRRLLHSVLEYWQHVLGRALAERHVPDAARARRSGGGSAHLGGVLGAWRDPAHLGGILLTWVPSCSPGGDPGGDPGPPRALLAPSLSPGAQVAALQEDKALLAAENRALRQRLQAGGAQKLQRLQAQVEELQEENCRAQLGRAQAGRAQLEAARRQVAELSGQQAEAALREERWQLELRQLRERCEALSREKEVGTAQLGRAQAGRAQLEAARRQVAELSGQQAEAALREERWQLELRQLRERCEALSREKERLQEQRDALREANEELRCAQELQRHLGRADAALEGGAAPARNLAAEILPAELRDTVTRLRRENRRLRLQRDQLRHRLEAAGAAEPQTAPGRPQEELALLEETPGEEEELKLSKAGFGGSTRPAPQNPPSAPGDPPGPAPLAPVLRLLRSQLQEKDALIRHLESDRERSWAQREREERLLVTAWYNMGLALQRHEAGAAMAAPDGGGALSFLAQQRLATAARRARAPHGRAPPS
ncbi:LOW QUALITY PROTEIN: protein Hook homolog 2-like [Passer montanus]|uniref:LOW QUALITY PROTEIN: protein Hook homolog 2-like n=1 Tax=Passer montanus TaxID=9160 RepID=UPI001960CC3D|nr:LOW QUALITY PROTEIN: protein Hook homolog 2-like [Passer montanus]